MKTRHNNSFGTGSLVTDSVKRFLHQINGALLRNEGRGFINIFLRILFLIPFRRSKSWVRVLRVFSREIHLLAQRNGVPYVIKYLKACSVLLQQSLGGHRHSAVQDLGVAVARTGSGIPRIIPAIHRKLILKDRRYVIAWLTLLNLFRVLVIPGTLKLHTITKPGKMLPGDLIIEIRNFIQMMFWPMVLKFAGTNQFAQASLEKNHRGNPPLVTEWARKALIPRYFSILKASGSLGDGEVSTSRKAMIASAKAWLADKEMWSHFCEWIRLLTPAPPRIVLTKGPQVPKIVQFKEDLVNLSSLPVPRKKSSEKFPMIAETIDRANGSLVFCRYRNGDIIPEAFELKAILYVTAHELDTVYKDALDLSILNNKYTSQGFEVPVLGRLATKEEAAGKIRVFAIVDCWTQWMLHPLHSAIFSLLRMIPQDGTFDQLRPVKLLKLQKNSFVASFDLSAATDRLPLQIQEMILGPVLGLHLAYTWGRLLTARTYWFKKEPYKYAVGQPMGALSSWGMLALTHHVIVQLAARRAKAVLPGKWFSQYAVLGDDIIITHEAVAESYRILMTQLGVEIGLAKSLVSKKGHGEFAKRYFIPQDASPISIKEVAVAWHSAGNLVDLIRKRILFKVSLSDVLGFLGYGYRAMGSSNQRYHLMSNRMRNWILMLTFPGAPFGRTLDQWVLALSTVRSSSRDIAPAYRSLSGVLTSRLHDRLKSYAPAIKRAWDVQMLERNVKLGFAKAAPDWQFLANKVWDSQKSISYEVSQIRAELKRISTLGDPRESFIALLKVEELIDALELPKDLEQRTSIQARFSWPTLVSQWWQVRSSTSSKNKKAQ